MKKIVYLVLLLGFVALIAGTIWNYNDYKKMPKMDFNEEVIKTIDMSKEHCTDNLCITGLYIEKTTDSYYGVEYALTFDMENKGDKTLKDFKLKFELFNKEEKITIVQDDKNTLEPNESCALNIPSIKKNIEKMRDYTFTIEK